MLDRASREFLLSDTATALSKTASYGLQADLFRASAVTFKEPNGTATTVLNPANSNEPTISSASNVERGRHGCISRRWMESRPGGRPGGFEKRFQGVS